MEALADHAKSERVCQQLLPMVAAYRGWITQQPKHPISDKEQNETAKQLRAQAEDCAKRIEHGIKLLADPLVREAFRTMNLVMARAQRQRSAISAKVPPDQIGTATGTRTPKWRFFQLAFVLMNLPGLAAADTPDGRLDREAVELLFFPTGGGKTEAYLGLAAFTLVPRRLRSPGIESAGVTVLMRYTLRLLTLDQLGRAATLICALELERLERAEEAHPYQLGEWPFEIGMWVGKAATPNKLGGAGDSDQQSIHAVLTKWKADKRDRPIPIETCPWCNRPLQPEGFHLLPPRNPDRLHLLGLCPCLAVRGRCRPSKPPAPAPGAAGGAFAAGQGSRLGLAPVGTNGGRLSCAAGVAVGLAGAACHVLPFHGGKSAPDG
jgi:hypothetical protein